MNLKYGQTRTTTRAESGAIDQGLRSYMLKIYNYMATGILVTGFVALFLFKFSVNEDGTLAPLGNAIYHSPLMWVIAFAPLGIVLWMSFGLAKMSASKAQTLFWVFAGLMGASLSSIFMVYVGASIARVFFITAATFATMSLYG